MSAWTADELDRIGGADEVSIASRRPDGTLRPGVTIWAIRLGDDIYIRSARGYENPWFQRALRSGQGRIRCRGAERDVTFAAPTDDVGEAVTAAYHAKYDRYGPQIVGSVVSPDAVRSTLLVRPA
jgi:hypothetical protein